MNKKKSTPLYLDDDLKSKLKEESNQQGLTLNAYIRLILIKRKKIK